MSYQEFRPRGFQSIPPVIKNLLIINILLFITTELMARRMGIDLIKILGLHYFSAPDFRPHQFVTYIFMHGGFMHLAMNMLAVWMLGSVLENVWGSKRFIIYYLITGFGAAIIQYVVYYFQINPVVESINFVQSNLTIENFENWVNSPEFIKNTSYEFYNSTYPKFVNDYNALVNESPGKALSMASELLTDYKLNYLNQHVVVGASGSLFGILIAFGMLFPNTQLMMIFFPVPIKAKYFVALYGALELYLGVSNNPGDSVAHFAHLGGMLFGFILLMIWKQNRSHFY